MEYRNSGWYTGTIWGHKTGPPAGSAWYIHFKQECASPEEAERVEEKAREAASNMEGGPSFKVERLHLVVFVELVYPRQTILDVFSTTHSPTLSLAIEIFFGVMFES
jgi:hypothetical protein